MGAAITLSLKRVRSTVAALACLCGGMGLVATLPGAYASGRWVANEKRSFCKWSSTFKGCKVVAWCWLQLLQAYDNCSLQPVLVAMVAMCWDGFGPEPS